MNGQNIFRLYILIDRHGETCRVERFKSENFKLDLSDQLHGVLNDTHAELRKTTALTFNSRG